MMTTIMSHPLPVLLAVTALRYGITEIFHMTHVTSRVRFARRSILHPLMAA